MFLRRFTKPKANISIVLDKYNLSFGEELTGVVRVKAEEEFDADEIRVSALCVALIWKRGTSISLSSEGISSREATRHRMNVPWSDHVTVSNTLHLTLGYEGEFPFSLMLPKSYPATDGRVGKMEWNVKGVITVKKRPDVTSKTITFNVIDRTRSRHSLCAKHMSFFRFFGGFSTEETSYFKNVHSIRQGIRMQFRPPNEGLRHAENVV